MKICYLSSLYNDVTFGGGVRNYLQIVSQELSKRGHSITILTQGNIDTYHKKVRVIGVKDVQTLTSKSVSLSFIFSRLIYMYRATKIIQKSNFDIVEAADGGFEHLLLSLLNKKSFKLVTRLHGRTSLTKEVFASKIMDKIEDLAIKSSDLVTSPTLSYSKLFHVKSAIIPYPIQTLKSVASFNVRKKYGIGNKEIILSVGMLCKRKGTDILIETASMFLNNSDVVFVVLGSNLENIDIEKFPKNVLYLGNKSSIELSSFYKQSDIFFMPSRFETFGIACAEAMSYGKPVVASHCVGLKDLVKNNFNGYLFKTGNSQQAYEKLQRLIVNKQLAKQLSKNSKKLSRQYSISKVIDIIENSYLKVISHD